MEVTRNCGNTRYSGILIPCYISICLTFLRYWIRELSYAVRKRKEKQVWKRKKKWRTRTKTKKMKMDQKRKSERGEWGKGKVKRNPMKMILCLESSSPSLHSQFYFLLKTLSLISVLHCFILLYTTGFDIGSCLSFGVFELSKS